MLDFENLMQQAKQFQTQFQEDVAKMSIKASAGGVTVTINGQKEVTDIQIDESAMRDRDLLADWILSATHKAYAQVDQELKDKLGGMGGLGNMDLSALTNLFK